jgi:ABC-type uncharacterized transport systems, ATPase components
MSHYPASPKEVELQFETLHKPRAEGTSIPYISHKPEEMRRPCDSCSTLTMGRKVPTCTPADLSAREPAEQMAGSSFPSPTPLGSQPRRR